MVEIGDQPRPSNEDQARPGAAAVKALLAAAEGRPDAMLALAPHLAPAEALENPDTVFRKLPT